MVSFLPSYPCPILAIVKFAVGPVRSMTLAPVVGSESNVVVAVEFVLARFAKSPLRSSVVFGEEVLIPTPPAVPLVAVPGWRVIEPPLPLVEPPLPAVMVTAPPAEVVAPPLPAVSEIAPPDCVVPAPFPAVTEMAPPVPEVEAFVPAIVTPAPALVPVLAPPVSVRAAPAPLEPFPPRTVSAVPVVPSPPVCVGAVNVPPIVPFPLILKLAEDCGELEF